MTCPPAPRHLLSPPLLIAREVTSCGTLVPPVTCVHLQSSCWAESVHRLPTLLTSLATNLQFRVWAPWVLSPTYLWFQPQQRRWSQWEPFWINTVEPYNSPASTCFTTQARPASASLLDADARTVFTLHAIYLLHRPRLSLARNRSNSNSCANVFTPYIAVLVMLLVNGCALFSPTIALQAFPLTMFPCLLLVIPAALARRGKLLLLRLLETRPPPSVLD